MDKKELEYVSEVQPNPYWLLLNHPIMAMMTGVKHIIVEHGGKTTLHYTDESLESAMVDGSTPLKMVHLIEAVQSKRDK